jgi:hypothetical protein
MRKQEITDDDAQRNPPERHARLFERRTSCAAVEHAFDLFGSIQRFRFSGK